MEIQGNGDKGEGKYRGIEPNHMPVELEHLFGSWRKDTDSTRGWQVSIFVLEIVGKREVLHC
jgi:hypothetical protein